MTDRERGPICLSCNKQADIDIYLRDKYTGESYCSYHCLKADLNRPAKLEDENDE